jgi:hypothetical protein
MQKLTGSEQQVPIKQQAVVVVVSYFLVDRNRKSRTSRSVSTSDMIHHNHAPENDVPGIYQAVEQRILTQQHSQFLLLFHHLLFLLVGIKSACMHEPEVDAAKAIEPI